MHNLRARKRCIHYTLSTLFPPFCCHFVQLFTTVARGFCDVFWGLVLFDPDSVGVDEVSVLFRVISVLFRVIPCYFRVICRIGQPVTRVSDMTRTAVGCLDAM